MRTMQVRRQIYVVVVDVADVNFDVAVGVQKTASKGYRRFKMQIFVLSQISLIIHTI